VSLRYNFDMAAPIFIRLTPEEDNHLQTLINDPNTAPTTRRRALALRLSAQGWSAPRIAQFLNCHRTTILLYFKRWQQHGIASLPRAKPKGAPPKITPEIHALLATLLTHERTWTAAQLCDAIAAQVGVRVHPATMTRHLKRLGYCYTRTRAVPAGTPPPEAVAAFEAVQERVKKGWWRARTV